MKTRMTMRVAKTIELRTSRQAERTTVEAGLGVAERRFSRRRRKTFSTSTMASSTNSPIATARPPSVMVLMPRPNHWKTMNVTKSDRGIAVSVMKVVRKLRRKRNSTIETIRLPSRRASSTLAIARSMKFACRKMSSWSETPSGSVDWRDLSSFSMARVSWTVSTLGCFETASRTAGWPLTPASPRFTNGPAARISAMSRRRMLAPPGAVFTTVLPRSSGPSTRAMLRISFSS